MEFARLVGVVACSLLCEHKGEEVTKSDLEDFLDETNLDPGFASFTSLWSNWVKKNEDQGRPQNTLTHLPGVEMDGDNYVYTVGADAPVPAENSGVTDET